LSESEVLVQHPRHKSGTSKASFAENGGAFRNYRRHLAPILEQILKPFGNKIPRSREHASDVDVMVIGRAGLADMSPALRKAEERLGREVNVKVYSPEEFREKLKSRNHFLAAVLRGRKQFLKGSQSDLDELADE
jgi:hypothetical protein